jgi:hypothetical protein
MLGNEDGRLSRFQSEIGNTSPGLLPRLNKHRRKIDQET